MKRLLPAFFLVIALPAAAQQKIPAAEQHLTAPSAPGQANKEIVAQPGATLSQASCGRVLQGEPVQRPAVRSAAAARAGSWAPPAGGSGEGFHVPPPSPADSEPTGPPLVESAYLTLRGTLASFDKGLVTIVDRNGRSRTVPLARGARVDGGLKAGDLVTLRVPLEDDPANKAASRVERQKAAAPPAMSSTSSKFAQAQTSAR
ncbi:MAG TPA: hypothetical protein VGM13_17395 [Thermoanaerobaculia bacterium]